MIIVFNVVEGHLVVRGGCFRSVRKSEEPLRHDRLQNAGWRDRADLGYNKNILERFFFICRYNNLPSMSSSGKMQKCEKSLFVPIVDHLQSCAHVADYLITVLGSACQPAAQRSVYRQSEILSALLWRAFQGAGVSDRYLAAGVPETHGHVCVSRLDL